MSATQAAAHLRAHHTGAMRVISKRDIRRPRAHSRGLDPRASPAAAARISLWHRMGAYMQGKPRRKEAAAAPAVGWRVWPHAKSERGHRRSTTTAQAPALRQPAAAAR